MIDISQSVAMKTVEFGGPISGQDLIDAVEKACQQAGGSLYKEKILDEDIRYLVGRRGWNNADNLLVTPDKTTAAIDPGKTYERAVVVRHDQPVARDWDDESGPYTRDQEIDSVLGFQEKLAVAVREQQAARLEQGLAITTPSQEAAVVLKDGATQQQVRFDRPTTGRDLMTAVRASCESEDFGTYYESEHRSSRYVVGQSSGLEYKSLVVMPDGGDGSIDPDGTYSGATVAVHHLRVPGQHRFPVRYTQNQEVEAVDKFVGSLQQNLRQQHSTTVGLDRGGPSRSADEGRAASTWRSGTARPGNDLSRG
ncbi:MAG TPA: hypothetical protein VFH76_00120 [Kribbella sp.]|nr:hypothetical protein [Kribbella sp.]